MEINKAKAAGVRFGPKPLLTLPVIEKVKALRADGTTVPDIMRRTKLSKASVYRALGGSNHHSGLATGRAYRVGESVRAGRVTYHR